MQILKYGNEFICKQYEKKIKIYLGITYYPNYLISQLKL